MCVCGLSAASRRKWMDRRDLLEVCAVVCANIRRKYRSRSIVRLMVTLGYYEFWSKQHRLIVVILYLQFFIINICVMPPIGAIGAQ